MPDVRDACRGIALTIVLALPVTAGAQQPDSLPVDSAARAQMARVDSVRADSIRRSELARIRGEAVPQVVRILVDTLSGPDRPVDRLAVIAASVSGDMIADLSPKAAARSEGSRLLLRDIEASVEATYSRATGLLAVTLTDDGVSRRVVATDAAVSIGLKPLGASARLIAGVTAFPFGRSAQLHRHALILPDQPLPVRVLLGETGLRATGLQLRSSRALGGIPFTLDLAVGDRFGARVDSLHPGEPADQSLAGLAVGGRFGTQFAAAGSRASIGVSSISGKREQPIGCVYQATVGPIPCPEGVNAANTRMTVFGGDARAAWEGTRVGTFAVSGEWMRLVVGATDLPFFSNTSFAAFYQGMHGTYDGGYVDAGVQSRRGLMLGGRAEWLQNPAVGGLNDGWLGGYLGLMQFEGAKVVASYQRRIPSSSAAAVLGAAERDARDRIVVRGTVTLGRHPRAGTS